MKFKFLILLTGISFLSQIIFSIFYSVAIVEQNSRYNQQQNLLQNQLIQQQHLEILAAQSKSLPALIKSATEKTPIKSVIDLSQ